jgi:hypothetical protein
VDWISFEDAFPPDGSRLEFLDEDGETFRGSFTRSALCEGEADFFIVDENGTTRFASHWRARG